MDFLQLEHFLAVAEEGTFTRAAERVCRTQSAVSQSKEETPFHDLTSIEVHADEMVLIAPPGHPLASRSGVRLRDVGGERFVVHHACSSTEEKILRLFERHHTRCHIVAELWSFESVKTFVQAEVGLAIVPRCTVSEELREGKLTRIHVAELNMPRRTLMIYRDQGYLSEPARQLIELVRGRPLGADIGPQPVQRRA